ncbi:hypothetical protein RCOM_0723020 [Ricinus communis]|uniref:Disease resistance N-terminal domain-containing protein n=1 Tax=Ricinus communis TaxID=3988 RepID=B9SFT5_RICCO|nr:hypothetical protein RCOM_0723020 [Ricinus communis]
MAEFLLGFALEEMLRRVSSLAVEGVILAWGCKRELKRLNELLTLIQAVLRDAEDRQERERHISVWLEKLKDVVFDAEDMVDEFEYEILRQRVEIGSQFKGKKDAVVFGLTRVTSVDRNNLFGFNRETDSFLDKFKVVGREDEVSKIVSLLISLSSSQVVSVVPIVGMAGL